MKQLVHLVDQAWHIFAWSLLGVHVRSLHYVLAQRSSTFQLWSLPAGLNIYWTCGCCETCTDHLPGHSASQCSQWARAPAELVHPAPGKAPTSPIIRVVGTPGDTQVLFLFGCIVMSSTRAAHSCGVKIHSLWWSPTMIPQTGVQWLYSDWPKKKVLKSHDITWYIMISLICLALEVRVDQTVKQQKIHFPMFQDVPRLFFWFFFFSVSYLIALIVLHVTTPSDILKHTNWTWCVDHVVTMSNADHVVTFVKTHVTYVNNQEKWFICGLCCYIYRMNTHIVYDVYVWNMMKIL